MNISRNDCSPRLPYVYFAPVNMVMITWWFPTLNTSPSYFGFQVRVNACTSSGSLPSFDFQNLVKIGMFEGVVRL